MHEGPENGVEASLGGKPQRSTSKLQTRACLGSRRIVRREQAGNITGERCKLIGVEAVWCCALVLSLSLGVGGNAIELLQQFQVHPVDLPLDVCQQFANYLA